MARDDDIRPLLEELQETLTTLRTELDGRDGERASGRPASAPRPRRPPRPPGPGEFLRFTEEYTIPTVVSLLEATIQSLELFAGLIRLLDPENPRSGGVGRRATREATRGATAALSELRRALSEVDLPPEGDARDIVTDARELSTELERRIEEGETRAHDNDPVSIDVRESGDRNDGDESGSVDVESELDSIRESVRKERDDDGADGDGKA